MRGRNSVFRRLRNSSILSGLMVQVTRREIMLSTSLRDVASRGRNGTPGVVAGQDLRRRWKCCEQQRTTGAKARSFQPDYAALKGRSSTALTASSTRRIRIVLPWVFLQHGSSYTDDKNRSSMDLRHGDKEPLLHAESCAQACTRR